MSIYAIADLHLSLSPNVDKPMDIYGGRWHEHTELSLIHIYTAYAKGK